MMTVRADHDGSYRRLFGHAKMVELLLTGFVELEEIQKLVFTRMERIDTAFLSEHGTRRASDMIWKIPWEGEPDALYVFVLIEFQSVSDQTMAIRMLQYISLLYEHIAHQNPTLLSTGLPPILPIVLHNGDSAWTATRDIESLIQTPQEFGDLRAYLPRLQYYLIDEGRLAQEMLEHEPGAVSLLFQLERTRNPARLAALVERLIAATQGEAWQKIRRDFTLWFEKVLLPVRNIRIPDTQMDTLLEVRDMLSENIKRWRDEAIQKGHAEGLVTGRAEGHAEGRAEGHAEGQQRALREACGHLLEQRFGPDSTRSNRLETLSLEGLQAIIQDVLHAHGEEELFERAMAQA